MKAVYMPRVIDAQYLHDYFIHIVFSNGREGKIDLSPFIGQGVFEPLLNKAYFKKLFVDGWTISWPNGADLAPETLYELVELSNSLVNEKGPYPYKTGRNPSYQWLQKLAMQPGGAETISYGKGKCAKNNLTNNFFLIISYKTDVPTVREFEKRFSMGDGFGQIIKLFVTLFSTSKAYVSEHIKQIYQSKELAVEATVRNFRTVQIEGNRSVTRSTDHYNLDMIIYGYTIWPEKIKN